MSIPLANGLIFKEIGTIDVFDIKTGNIMFSVDELTDCSIQHTEETQDVTGRNGRIISRIKRNKGVTISGTNGLISSGLLALQLGCEYNSGDYNIMWTDYLTINRNAANTKYIAVGVYGAEIISCLLKDPETNGICGELQQADQPTTGKFSYDPSRKTLLFSGIQDGTQVVVKYMRKITSVYLRNDADKFSGRAMMYINGLAEDECSNVYHVQFFFPKVDFRGDFTIDFSDSQTVHNFEAIALAGSCGAENTYYTYTVYGERTEDSVKLYYTDSNNVYVDSDNRLYVSSK